MTFLAHLADRALNRPLLIMPEKAAVILQVLGGRIGVNAPEASRFEGEWSENENGRLRPFKRKGGVAVLPIVGSLVNRGAWIGANSGLVSYEGIQHQLKEAAAASDVESIVLDIQSPGGEAVGAFETAEMVRSVAAEKRVVAVVNGMAASAAYAIASAASEIVTIETGIGGSIGVVLLHADYSRALANEGIKPTFVFAGAHKVDGNPFEPLPDGVRDDLQAEIDAFYEKFLTTVAKGRGARLTAEMARATEARTFIGQDAVARGLADRVGTFESVLSDLSSGVGRTNSQSRSKAMSEKTGASAAENDAGITQADLDKAVANAKAEGVAEGKAEAEKANEDAIKTALATDRTRIASILEINEPGAEAIVSKGIQSGASAGDVALEIAKSPEVKEKRKGAAVLSAMEGDDASAQGAKPAGEGGGAVPQTEDGWKAEFESNADLQEEFGKVETYVSHKKLEAREKGDRK